MPGSPTPRLGLPTIAATTDTVASYPGVNLSQMDTLDNAVTVTPGTLVTRPTGSYVGQTYYATDTGLWYFYTGSAWQTVALLGDPFGPLRPATANANVTATAGTFLTITGTAAVTVTLPAHTAGQRVKVINVGTGGTTVSGTAIQGVGLSSASSFPLGMVGASAELLDDGTNWYVVDGGQDSGWQALTLASGVSALAGSFAPSARLRGDTVTLRGVLTGTSISTWATLPVGLAPASDVSTAIRVMASNGSGVLSITTGGALTSGANLTGAQTAYLDGVNYSLN